MSEQPDDMMSARSETTLHVEWRGGSRRAGAALYGRYCGPLTALGRKLGLGDADAQDLAHETLMDAVGSEFHKRPGATYWSWLSRIAYRKAAAIPFQPRHEGPRPRRVTTPWGALERRRLLDSIERMPESQRQVFERILLGHTAAEVAQSLDIDRMAVYMRVRRGRQWLVESGH